ncbi:hypothetical protein DSO57_1002618 [Entomophthora muscae]|uniref:Uncharacterized protein n=1 Tax=Entomophthora muscae TaxID=34485 RepID=A0ACC2SXQ3_9FUNG|nr:hypothetical protein DSO57_1002618 [Entomophthora muscae]
MDPEKVKKYDEILSKMEPTTTDFWKNKFKKEASKNWDLFYKRNTTNFFKDRHWINREFTELNESLNEGIPKVGFEIGCGVGNFIFPVLKENPQLFLHACDFSTRAIEFVKKHDEFDTSRCNPFVCDITKDDISSSIDQDSVDFASAIFVLSALPPEKMVGALLNIKKVLKPNGLIFFRDYAKYDAAQMRFKAENKLEDRLYVRQDGTLAYYFTIEELNQLFGEAGFKTVASEYVLRETVNVKKGISAERVFVQATFTKI